MSSWYQKNLGEALMAIPEFEALKTQVAKLKAEHSGAVVDLYYRHQSNGQLHCDLMVYLYSDNKRIMNEIQAKVCAKPSQSGLSRLDSD
ncbi:MULTISPECIES: hypothetical protein [Vibrio]|uniref:Uncharacterized protein n=1 Tax=Vibrio algicola TaxID=2662262 RepID=A0A5Q0TJV0_9VIBR|nr:MULTISPECIES: hypothetical protein [Vibrio]MBD1577127.1 hypothetical protein [Vibrio sp. S11_S32]